MARALGSSGGEVNINEIDYVEDSTVVDARCVLRKGAKAGVGASVNAGAAPVGIAYPDAAAQKR